MSVDEWVAGVGSYDHDIYVVRDASGGQLLFFMEGASAGKWYVDRQDARLVLVHERNQSRVVLYNNMFGCWNSCEAPGRVFSPGPPEGVYNYALDVLIEEWVELVCSLFEVVNAPDDSFLLIRNEFGHQVGHAVSADAAPGTPGRLMADALEVPFAKDLRVCLQQSTPLVALRVPYYDASLLGGTIVEQDGHWLWQRPCGDSYIGEYCVGDASVNLADMVNSGVAKPLGLNLTAGRIDSVLGLPIFSAMAYPGREGVPTQFVVPMGAGQQSTVHVAVKHQVGNMVYGFTVRRRDGDIQPGQLEREVVALAEPPDRRYFFMPDDTLVRIAR